MAKGVFKVGDIVKGIKGNGYSFTNDQMTKAAVVEVSIGVFGTPLMRIRMLEHKNKYHIGNTIEVENNDSKFTLVKPETIVIYRKGNEVIAHNKTTGKKGVAKCNPEDTFDFTVGAKLAFDRLVGRPTVNIEEPKFKKGDLVEVIEKFDRAFVGLRGEIVKQNPHTGSYLVDFKVEYHFTHRGHGDLLHSTGYWLQPKYLKKVN